jgi:hypothetical protein
MPIFVYTMKFTSPTKCEILFYDDKDFPEIAKFRFEVELPSPDTMLQTTFADGKVVRKDTFKKVK